MAEPAIDLASLSDAALNAISWHKGELAYLCRDYQAAIFEAMKLALWGAPANDNGGYLHAAGKHRKFCLEIHRRWGKSSVLGVLAIELCIQKPGARVYWAAETQKQVKKIVRAVLRPLLKDCPKEQRPVWLASEGIWVFPNGSEIHLAGCEDEAKADRLRGDGCDLFIIDEAGSIDLLEYVYRSIAIWMVADRDGRIIMASTPARTPAHPFTAYCIGAELGDGGFAHRDVYESGWSQQKIDELAKDCGGYDSPDWQREGLAQRVVDLALAIVPEFSAPPRAVGHEKKYSQAEFEIVQPLCMRCGLDYDEHEHELCADTQPFLWAFQRPEWFDPYVSTDIGFDPSLTATIGGYYACLDARLVIEGEREQQRQTTADIATAVHDLEAELFADYWADKLERGELVHATGDLGEREARPWRRISDVDPQWIYDMRRLHKLHYIAVRKDDKEAMISETRLWVRQRKLAIHPRCRKLRAHLRAGIFVKDKRPKFAFIDGFGHFDFCDALIYLIRMIDKQHSPWPEQPPADLTHTKKWRRAKEQPKVPQGYEGLADVLSGANRRAR